MNPSRRANRTRGIGPLAKLARDPLAAGIALAENPNRGLHDAATLGFTGRTIGAKIIDLDADHESRQLQVVTGYTR